MYMPVYQKISAKRCWTQASTVMFTTSAPSECHDTHRQEGKSNFLKTQMTTDQATGTLVEMTFRS